MTPEQIVDSSEQISRTRAAFLRAAVQAQALRFGEFTLKSGRVSPYFFNAGLFNTGAHLTALGQAYANTLIEHRTAFDMLFGPAYKGIVLAALTAQQLHQSYQLDVPYAYNRKEAKDHGEGGQLVGAALRGRVVIVDDVISAGTSVRESVQMIREAGASPVAVLIALDRQERGSGQQSAAQQVEQELAIPVWAVANLSDLFSFVKNDPLLSQHGAALTRYRDKYAAT